MAGKRIVLKDGTATLFDGETQEGSLRIDSLVEPERPLILPAGCRLQLTEKGSTVYVIEQPPSAREVAWKPADGEWAALDKRKRKKYGLTGKDEGRRRFLLSFPFTVFVVRTAGTAVDSLKVFYRGQPLRTESDFLLQTGLDQAERVPPIPKTARPHGFQPEMAVDEAVEAFWRQEYSADNRIFSGYRELIAGLETVWDWEYRSREDQFWVMKAGWKPAPENVGQIVRQELDRSRLDHSADRETFLVMARRIGEAQVKRGRTTVALIASPSASVRLGNVVVRAGAELFVDGEKRTVIGFYEPAADGKIFALFEGVEQPVCLGGRESGLDRKFSRPPQAPKADKKAAAKEGGPVRFGEGDQVRLREDVDEKRGRGF